MSSWSVVLAVLVICAIILGRLEKPLSQRLQLRRLKSGSRCIDAGEAITKYESGLGILIRNQSSLPGDWWFLGNDAKPTDGDLVGAAREFGYVVIVSSKESREAIEAYSGKVEEMYEPWVD